MLFTVICNDFSFLVALTRINKLQRNKKMGAVKVSDRCCRRRNMHGLLGLGSSLWLEQVYRLNHAIKMKYPYTEV
jgi:hypothetical protein